MTYSCCSPTSNSKNLQYVAPPELFVCIPEDLGIHDKLVQTMGDETVMGGYCLIEIMRLRYSCSLQKSRALET